MTTQSIKTQCCIVGGGPAALMCGYLLARQGIAVTVLEKWSDFFRDFRGDTIHPSTLQVLKELGLLESFLKLPLDKTTEISAVIGDQTIPIADFSQLKTACPYLAFIPQWHFLNFMAEEAKKFPNFTLLMATEGVDLLIENNKVVGVKAKSAEGTFDIHATLVIGADGRHSTMREKSLLPLIEVGAPIDVLWFRITRKETDKKQSIGRLDKGRMMVMINRTEYWQCGFIIPKGSLEELKTKGINALHDDIALIAPELSDRFEEINTWEKIKLLQVAVNRLKKWYRPGLLCIGDAAHAMSPVGGVGINLAIQDAVAAANILTLPLRNNAITENDLCDVQKRREFPTKVTQRIQVIIQNRVINRVLQKENKPFHPPLITKLFLHCKKLRKLPAYLIGIGVRPEHPAPLSRPLT